MNKKEVMIKRMAKTGDIVCVIGLTFLAISIFDLWVLNSSVYILTLSLVALFMGFLLGLHYGLTSLIPLFEKKENLED